jgi:hypothetical protein
MKTFTCPHCNQPHPAGACFCPVTGETIPEQLTCTSCGHRLHPGWKVCPECGGSLGQEDALGIVKPEKKSLTKRKRKWWVGVLFLGAFLLVGVGVVVGYTMAKGWLMELSVILGISRSPTTETEGRVREQALGEEAGLLGYSSLVRIPTPTKTLTHRTLDTPTPLPTITEQSTELAVSHKRVVYFLTGHGEYSPGEFGERSYSQARLALENKNYIVMMLNLLISQTIPQDAAAIVIAGPTKPISEGEVALLWDFLDGGGALVVLAEPLPISDFGGDPDPLADYIEEAWGIVLGKDMVVDLTSNQVYIAVINQYSDHQITQRLQGLVTIFPTARSVTVNRTVEDVDLYELAFTAPQSWAETDLEALMGTAEASESPQIAPDEGVDIIGPVPLSAAAENYISGSRLVVFGDSDFASDAFFNQYGNEDLLVNAIDWAIK